MEHQLKERAAAPDGKRRDTRVAVHPKTRNLQILACLTRRTATLVLANGVQKAAIVDQTPDKTPGVLMSVELSEVSELIQKSWIRLISDGKVTRYQITPEGRIAAEQGFAKIENAAQQFDDDDLAEPDADQDHGPSRAARRSGLREETPLQALARRKDRNGDPFLSADLVRAGDRLSEDFELAKCDPVFAEAEDPVTGPVSVARALTCPDRKMTHYAGRVVQALGILGPGLSDVVIRCCCFLHGIERVEKEMGWSARSGKIVLRIALEQLKHHYDSLGDDVDMVG